MAVPTRSGRFIVLGLLASAGTASAELIPTLKFAAEERYDDDLLLRQGNSANAGQVVTKLSPQIGLDVKERTLTLHSFYAADFFLHSASRYSGVDHRGSLDFKNAFSHVFALEGRTEIWRVSDPTSLPRVGLARTISPILYGWAELVGVQRLSARTTLRVGYRFEGTKVYERLVVPEGSTAPPDAGLAHVPFAELWHRATRRSEIGVEYRFQYFTLGSQTSDANSVAALYRYRLSPETRLTVRAGPTYYQRLDHSPSNFTRTGWMPRFVFDLTHDSRVSRITAAIGHELTGASGLSSGLWAEYASLFGSHRLWKELSVFAGASLYRNGSAANVGIDSFSPARGIARGYWVNAGLEWRLTRDLALSGIFTRLTQLGSQAVGVADLTRNVFAVRLVYTAL